MTKQPTERPGKVYISGVSDHAHALAAALRAYDQPAEVMPPTTPETLAIGMGVGKGRECMYSLMIIGDLLQRARQPDFDPQTAALFQTDFTRRCVAVNYRALITDTLRSQGLETVEVLAPSSANGFRGMGSNPDLVRSLTWHGFVAIDLLIRLLHQRRPYELQPGASDLAYQHALAHLVAAIETGDASKVGPALAWGGKQFEAVAIDRSVPRPRIGMHGDFYMLYNPYLYLNAIRQIEGLGGEVEITRFAKFFYYINWMRLQETRIKGDRTLHLKIALEDAYQHHVEAELVATIAHLLTDTQPVEPPASVTIGDIQRYYHVGIVNGGFSIGTGVDLARSGCAGLLHIVPFLCIGSIIGAAMGSRVRTDLDQIPWLDIIFDAQGGTNVRTRLEAFMFQAVQFQRARSGVEQLSLPVGKPLAPFIPLASQVAEVGR